MLQKDGVRGRLLGSGLDEGSAGTPTAAGRGVRGSQGSRAPRLTRVQAPETAEAARRGTKSPPER